MSHNTPGKPGQPPAPPAQTVASVNWAEALAAVNQDRELLCDVIDAFLSEAPKLLVNVRQALEEKNAELLHHAAHTLKGNMRFFGVVSAVEPALALEQMGKKGEFADAADRLAVLESEMSRLFPALHEFIGREKC
jgi:HPt (histidine-containing phosphotransfer) domain-containing protein